MSPTFGPSPLAAVARRFPLRATAIVGLVLLAYNYSLMTLFRGLSLQTPLAYLALVPVLAFALGAIRLRLLPNEVPIHDRQLDWIIGISLLASSAAILILLPEATSSTFWLDRIDLLTLPIFAAGLVVLFYGVRRAWSLRFPLVFLVLAWPIPFSLLLSATADTFTTLTARAVGAITAFVPVARPALGDETLFLVGSGESFFGVSIGTACSGVNSFVGFLLLGAAMLYLFRGPLFARLAWLAAGLGLTVALNVARIMVILVVGNSFGEEAALDVLHPIAGLLVFNIGVVGMVLLAPVFGLRFIGAQREQRSVMTAVDPVNGIRAAFAVALVISVGLGVTNAAYARYEAISAGLADARLTHFDIETAHVPGWKATYVGDLSQARQYFGSTATWDRVIYRPTGGAEMTSSRAVYVDVLTTDDAGTFAAYGLEACYTFHGYEIASVTDVDIGAGVNGQVIDYINPRQNIAWSALWWEWPYEANGQTRYERIVVFMADGPKAEFTGSFDVDVATQDARFELTDQFLASLGREIVRAQIARAEA